MKSFSLFIACLLLSASAITFTSCQKEYSYESGPTTGIATGTAVYTLAGDGGNCTAPVINGIYKENVPLQSSNSIVLGVNVTAIGTYTLGTVTVNGFQFSTSGNFTVTGLQTIILAGTGTPITAGISPFTPPAGSGCSFFITVTK